MATTAQNTKISSNSPARKLPGKWTASADPWANRPKICRDGEQKKQQQHWETSRNFPILSNKQIQNLYKKSKNTKYIYIYIQSLQGHSLGFDDLILFLNLFNKL